MHKVVIADTSCLIVLQKLELLIVLKNLYTEVLITSAIAEEYSLPLPHWIEIKNPLSSVTKAFESSLDPGEASAIALAAEIPEAILILDGLQARRVAAQLSLNYTGTLGVLAKAKKKGLIESIKPILSKLRELNFRISSEVEEDILIHCNEK
ncbi:MAG TPA: DUF3368 domain-containing protein [Cyclobacteriaceae bacterium]|nr:DUF3368 domain-containing protein [Cyclobacteriaceae bacterium]HRJ80836.1 DUF3368 domain-containing protein [Cyclobacteriaceae bacterium]